MVYEKFDVSSSAVPESKLYFLLSSGITSVQETLCGLRRNGFCLEVCHAPLHMESRWEANTHKTEYSGKKWVCCAHDWTHRAMLSQCQANLKSCVKKWEILEESKSHMMLGHVCLQHIQDLFCISCGFWSDKKGKICLSSAGISRR